MRARIVAAAKSLWRRWTAIDVPWPDVARHRQLQAEMRKATLDVRRARLQLRHGTGSPPTDMLRGQWPEPEEGEQP